MQRRALALLAGLGWLAGCASLPAPAALRADATPLRVVTWNIGLGVFLDPPAPRFSRLSRGGLSIRNALAHHPELRGFDILAVQELCSHDSGRHVRYLVEIFDYFRVFARSDAQRLGECQKGEAIFSRYPIVNAGVLQLPAVRRVGRSLVWAELAVPVGQQTRPVRVYNLHLDNKSDVLAAPEARWLQMQPVLLHIEAWLTDQPDGAVLLLGDFNTTGHPLNPWVLESTITGMKPPWRSALEGHHSTWLLLYQLDWIFYRGLDLQRARVVDVLLSDHYPLAAELLLPPAVTLAPAKP